MKFSFNSVAAFISSSIFISSVAHAEGGANGANGGSEVNSDPINLIIENKNAKPGTIGSDSSGGHAGNILGVDFSYGQAGGPRLFVTGDSGAAGQGGTNPNGGGGGSGGNAGASLIGGLAIGGAGGYSTAEKNITTGGKGGSVSEINLKLDNVELDGSGKSGGGGSAGPFAGGGVAGNGGGSVFGGISIGGAGGYSKLSGIVASGGYGGLISDISIRLDNVNLNGSSANGGGSTSAFFGSSGAAGHGGGAVFGGISTGGAGGQVDNSTIGSGQGGDGGSITNISIQISGSSSLTGGAGGGGGNTNSGGAGAGGHGGGSVFGGISTGGSGGRGAFDVNGGVGGDISASNITLENVTLDGTNAVGGRGGDTQSGGAGAGGHGGGSVFGGISTGGSGGSGANANGGDAGSVSKSNIYLSDFSSNVSPLGGQGGTAANPGGGVGASGYRGGSVFGGISTGGNGGEGSVSSNGGAGGNIFNNKITLEGMTNISGNVYGGISQGGAKGSFSTAIDGQGGRVTNNTVTLIGDNISIAGSLYGGLSKNGDFLENPDPTYNSFYAGNTINFRLGKFTLNGEIRNFQNYNWTVPLSKVNDTNLPVVDASGASAVVNLSNTIQKVDVDAIGNVLHAGDKFKLINNVSGNFDRVNSSSKIEQGYFIVYDSEIDIENINGDNVLTVTVLGVIDNTPDGRIHHESEEFLKGRIAQLAIADQGADMISDGISYARASLRKRDANLFVINDGGSNKYKNGGVSSLKLNDFKFALGAAKAFEFNNNVGMIAAFAEHGNGNYNSYNTFDYFGDTSGSGKVRYSGIGFMGHMAVANTDVSKVKNNPNIFDDKYGLYLDAALRTGHVKVDFHSADMVNGQGVEARYNTKSRYASAMLGAGYVWTLDEKSAMDFYARYTYSRLNGKDVQVVDEQMNAGAAHSKRLRLGARYGYAYSSTTTPYAGLAFERNFTGDVTGSAYGLTIKETSLKGNTGMLEAGVMIKPKGADDPFSLRLGIQGYFGQRKGATADIRARYVF